MVLCCCPIHKKHMQKKTDDLDICGGRVGLKPSLGKSKVMVMKNGNNTPIQILGTDLQQAFYKLRPVLSSAMYSTKTKINLYCSNVKSVLLYGAENWKLIKKETFQNRSPRRILGM